MAVDHPKTSKLYSGSQKPDVLADAKDLPFPDQSFDVALLLQVLEYIENPQDVINEAARIIKSGGVLIITSPFLYPIHDPPYDRGRYTKTALSGFLQNANLKIVKLIPQGNFWDFWFLSLNVYLMRRIKDVAKYGGIKKYILVPLLVAIGPPIIIASNLLGLLGSKVSIIPEKQNYFPLNYLIIAKKA